LCKIEPYEGVNEWIDFCILKNIQIGVLTNGIINAQQNKWNCLKINNKEKIQFTPSREFENDKPNVHTFEKFMLQINANWETTLFVGDRFENDLEQGIKNGSHGILIGSESKHKNVRAFHTIQKAFNYFQTL
jgi:FMN phosphatase YigB (HAD superfamily)